MINLEDIKDRRDTLQSLATSWVNGEPATEVFVPTATLAQAVADYDTLLTLIESGD